MLEFLIDSIFVMFGGQLRVRNSSVKGGEVKWFNVIAEGEGPRLYVL
jgi:hypothetical protein